MTTYTVIRPYRRPDGKLLNHHGRVRVHRNFGFTTTWNIESGDLTATLPLDSGNTSQFDCIVYWGDGTSSEIKSHDDPNRIHTYENPGIYDIEIVGICEGWSFNSAGDKLKVINIKHWGTSKTFAGFKYLLGGFAGCVNMKCTAPDSADVSRVVRLRNTFSGCSVFNGILSRWNTSNVTDMYRMFRNCSVFNNGGHSGIDNWNVGNVSRMDGMFRDTSFNQYIGSWDTKNVTQFIDTHSTGGTFQGSPFNNGEAAGESNKPLNWDVGKASHFAEMFRGAPFNQDISSWNTVSAIYMAGMFRDNVHFNQDISSWDVSNVQEFYTYFSIGNDGMFRGASSFNQNLGAWDVGSATKMEIMFSGSALNDANYAATIVGWTGWVDGAATKAVQENVTAHFGTAQLTPGSDAADARYWLINTKFWTITDGDT